MWIDGTPAFHASNRGHGGADDFHTVGKVSVAEVDAWLAANRPVTHSHGVEFPVTLDIELAAMMDMIAETKQMRRKTRTHVVTIDGAQVFAYPLIGRTPAVVIEGVRKRSPNSRIVNDDDAAITDAVRLLLATASTLPE